jgi:hypothetical protein
VGNGWEGGAYAPTGFCEKNIENKMEIQAVSAHMNSYTQPRVF